MPGNFVFKPRLTDALACAASRTDITTGPLAYAVGVRPSVNLPPKSNAVFKPRIVTTFPTAPLRTDVAPRPLAYGSGAPPAVKPAPRKYVSSTHYARYILWQGRHNSELIIESHGLRIFDGRRNALPSGMTLHFYGPDGAALCTPTIDYAFLDRGLAERPYERVQGGRQYPDYLLSKFELGPERGKDGLYKSFINCLDRYDVLSLEQLNDNGGPETLRLSQVIAHLISQGHRYAKVHCIFCRSISPQDIRRDPALRRFVRPDYFPLTPPAGG